MNDKKYVNLIVFLFITLYFTLSFVWGDALTSGFYPTDDAQVVEWENLYLQSDNFFSFFVEMLKQDFEVVGRFRPVLILQMIFGLPLIGSSYFLWSLTSLILLISSAFLFYRGMQQLGFNSLESLVFSFFSLVGLQTISFIRLVHCEPVGTFFLGIIFLLMSRLVSSKKQDTKQKKHYKILLFLFFLLLSLTKESFILFIPALVFLMNYLYKENNNISWKETLKEFLPLNLGTTLFVFVEILIILLFIGTNEIKYAGFDQSTSFIRTLAVFIVHFEHNLAPASLILFIFAILAIFKIIQKDFDAFLSKLSPVFILFFLILVPQCILHAKSAMGGRYLIPVVFGCSFALVFLMRELRLNLHSEKNKWFKQTINVIFSLVLFVAIIHNSLFVAKDLIADSKTGRDVKGIINTLLLKSSDNRNIILIGDFISDFHWLYYTNLLLNKYKDENTNVYVYFTSKDGKNTTADYNGHRFFDAVFNKKQILTSLDNNMSQNSVTLLFAEGEKHRLADFSDSLKQKSYSIKNFDDDFSVYSPITHP